MGPWRFIKKTAKPSPTWYYIYVHKEGRKEGRKGERGREGLKERRVGEVGKD